MSGRVVDLAVNPKIQLNFTWRMLQADFGIPITTELLFLLIMDSAETVELWFGYSGLEFWNYLGWNG